MKREYVLNNADLIRALLVGATRCGFVDVQIEHVRRCKFQQVENGAVLTLTLEPRARKETDEANPTEAENTAPCSAEEEGEGDS